VGKIVRAPCRPNSGLPEFGTLEWPKSDISDFGCRTGMADDFAHPTTTRMTASRIELSIALSDNERTRPLLKGEVVPQGIKLVPTMIHPSEMFWRQLRFAEFDVSEMSMSSLIISISRGERSWVAIPVFTMRKFFHTSIIVRNDAGITSPADLRGKRIGVPEYQQTWAIWARGVLEHEFGVQPRDIEWFMERNPDKSHGGATGFRAPDGVRVNQIPPADNIGEMLVRGALDGALHYLVDKNLVDRSSVDISAVTRYLFPDPAAEGRRFYAKTGLYPINHGVVMRRSLYESHPWIALNLYSAFTAAKEKIARCAKSHLAWYIETGLLDTCVERTLAEKDPLAYGVKSSRTVLETITRYVHEQGLCSRRVALDEIFAPSTLDL
jgi:4,5-dihydroxyphthalate decarboxylase